MTGTIRMAQDATTLDDPKRLDALRAYEILDSPHSWSMKAMLNRKSIRRAM